MSKFSAFTTVKIYIILLLAFLERLLSMAWGQNETKRTSLESRFAGLLPCAASVLCNMSDLLIYR